MFKFKKKLKKIAFVIPTYTPDYNYAKNLIKTFKKFKLDRQADLYFVFTNEIEAHSFGEYKYKIILDEKYRILENNGIINIKKYFGLKQLQNKYEYLIVIDSESEFVKNVDLYEICNEIYEKKELFGNTIWNFEYTGVDFIRNRCKEYFKSHPSYALLFEQEKNLYLWFSNLPVYKSEFLDEFFSVIDYDKNIANLNGFDFDHYIYMYYLILYRGFTVVDLKMHGFFGAGESMPEAFCFVPGKQLDHKFNMCAKQALAMLDNDKLFVVIQIDRILSGIFWVLAGTMANMHIKLLELEEKIKLMEENCKG